MQIRFSAAARNELNDACDWYELQQPGLGLRFRNDVRKATFQIARTPLLFPIVSGRVGTLLCPRGTNEQYAPTRCAMNFA